MAPDVPRSGHQLVTGNFSAATRIFFGVCVLCLVLGASAVSADVRAEPADGAWSSLAIAVFHGGQALGGDAFLLSPGQDRVSFPSPAFPESSGKLIIPLADDPIVHEHIRHFQNGGRVTYEDSLKRAARHIPMMEEIFAESGVPTELVFVALVESRFRDRASSRCGAAGLWQLMPSTARVYGLRVDKWVDERMDPVKSTRAAARHLQELYETHGDWTLALAAYNAGSQSVQKAVAKKRTTDFNELCRLGAIPRQTRSFVPRVLAAMIIARNLERYGFDRPEHATRESGPRTVAIRAPMKLKDVARMTGTTVAGLRDLNPALKRDELPPGRTFELNLPPRAADLMERGQGAILEARAR